MDGRTDGRGQIAALSPLGAILTAKIPCDRWWPTTVSQHCTASLPFSGRNKGESARTALLRPDAARCRLIRTYRTYVRACLRCRLSLPIFSPSSSGFFRYLCVRVSSPLSRSRPFPPPSPPPPTLLLAKARAPASHRGPFDRSCPCPCSA